jgi:hypothetical protein
MKKRILSALAIAALALSLNITAAAKPELTAPTTDPLVEPTIMRVTCYMDKGITASGTEAREGIVAVKPEWMQEGYIVQIWAVRDGKIGDFMGYYEPKDTGYGIDTGEGESRVIEGRSRGSIEAGWSIDVFCESEAEVAEWQAYGDYFYIRILTNCKG